MTDKDFFYRRRHEAFLEATRGWPWQLAAFYSILLDVIYHFEGKLPDDLGTIRAWIGPDLSEYLWKKFRGELIARGKLVEGIGDGRRVLRNVKVDELIATRKEEREKNPKENPKETQKKQAKKTEIEPNGQGGLFNGSNGSWSLSGSYPRAPADSLESESRVKGLGPDAATMIDQVDRIAETLGQKRGRYWEADYGRMIASEGFSFEDVLEAARAHKAKSGELLRSMNGLKGLARLKHEARLERGHTPTPAIGENGGDIPVDDWKTALVKLALNGVWGTGRLGPMPGVEGYQGPRDLELAFLEQWKAQGSHPVNELDVTDNFVPYPAERPDDERRARWKAIRT